MPQWHAVVCSVFVGALVEWNADAVACARPFPAGLRAPHFGRLSVEQWERAAVAVLADPRVRASPTAPDASADRDAPAELTRRLEPHIGDLQCVQRALLLLDDEPLLVLDRACGRGPSACG
ncbi:hypothetical protein [Streptomyces erythrochromogenes]|uniref:hypothetical protein n=1 Tax=Streptomyces erythrochromogenes TaxID=285574 RepID=UPI00382CDAA8